MKHVFLLCIGFLPLYSFSQSVVINEVCTSPKQDWSTHKFNGTIGTSPVSDNDEWIELFINEDGLNLSNWTLELNDGTDVVCKLTTTGSSKFAEISYFSETGGNINNTKAGDFVVLGNPTGAMNNSITIILKNENTVLVDAVILGGSGNAPDGGATETSNEVVCRLNNGKDSNIDANDFFKTIASLGKTNSPNGKIVINELVTSPRQDFDVSGTISDATDEYVELYISTNGMNLTGYTLDIIDGSDNIFKGKINSGGVFASSNYISSNSGNFYATKAGDYYYLLNPNNEMNNDTKLVLYDASGNKVDSLTLNSNGYPSGNSSELGDESVSRIPDGLDTDLGSDFLDALATPGAENKVYTLANFPPRPGSGYCLEFNGINQGVNLSKPIALNLKTNFTIEQWILPTEDNGAFSFKGHYSSVTANSGWTASVEGNKIVWSLRNNAEVVLTTPSNSIELNKWQHVALVMGTNTATIYINGVLQASATASIRDNLNYDFQIGRRAFSPIDKYFTGKIDEVRIWNKALTETEIRTYMCQKITTSTAIYSSLLSYYTFDTGTGNTLFDFKSVNYGTLSGSPNWKYSGAPIGDESAFLYPNASNWNNQKLDLNTSNKGDFSVRNVGQSPVGLQVYQVSINPNTSNGTLASKNILDSYFGVFPIESLATSPSFDISYSYADNASFLTKERYLIAGTRTANDGLIWVKPILSKDSVLDTIYLTSLNNRIEFLPYVADTNNFTIASGNWEENSNWFFGTPIASEFTEISPNHYIRLNSEVVVSGLKLNFNSSIDIQTNSLEISDSTIVLDPNATISLQNGTVKYSKNGNQNMLGANYGKLIIDNTGTKEFDTNATISKSIKLNSSAVILDVSKLTFLSNATQTASLEQVPSGATIIGDAKVQRFIDANTRTWYHISSPISGAKVSDWIDDFPISGNFIGASQITSSKSPSIYWYDETEIGTSNEIGWVGFPASNLNEIIESGRGYKVFLRENSMDALGDTTIELSGQVNSGEIEIPVFYTSLAVEDEEAAGWNFIGNPYASPIDWDSEAWDKTNIENAVYVWDAGSDPKYASYVDGVSANGGSNLIASGQGFWVKANAPNPYLKINEGAKSSQNRALLRPQLNPDLNYLSITFQDSLQQISTVLRFTEQSSENFDEEKDARYFSGASMVLCTYDNLENYYSINSQPYPIEEKEFPLYILCPTDLKKYQLKFDFTGDLGSSLHLFLRDKKLNSLVKISSGVLYDFESSKLETNRFSIIARPLMPNASFPEIENHKFSIFPNPITIGSEYIYLERSSENSTEVFSITLFDILGEKLDTVILNSMDELVKIPLKNRKAGIYLLQVIDMGNELRKQKIQIIE